MATASGSPPKARSASAIVTRRRRSRASCAGSKRPGHRARAEERRSRSARPPRRRTRPPRARTAASRPAALGDRDRGQHAQRAVVAAGVDHRVEVRAEHQRSGPSPRRPIRLPAASSRTARPASRIQPPTSSYASRIAGVAKRRTRRSGSSLMAPSASQRSRTGRRCSTAPVGAVGPGGDEQRHVVVRAGVGRRGSGRARRPGSPRRSARRRGTSARTRRLGDVLEQRLVGAAVGVGRRAAQRPRAAAARRASSIGMPAAGRPRAVSSTWVVITRAPSSG